MSKRYVLIAVVIVMLGLLVYMAKKDIQKGPAQKPAVTETKDIIENEIKAKAKPVVQHFFETLQAKDFEGMRKDFDDKMLEVVPAEMFEKGYAEEFPKIGKMDSWDYTGWMRGGGFDIVLVEAKHAKGDAFQYKFVFKKGPEGKKISGLWKKPLPMGLSKVETDAMLNLFGSIAQDHLKAVKANDFQAARKDFSQAMLDALSPEKLKQSVADPKIGTLNSWKFDHAKRESEFVSLHYHATFSEGETLAYKFVFKSGGKDKKIEGLWLKPLGAE